MITKTNKHVHSWAFGRNQRSSMECIHCGCQIKKKTKRLTAEQATLLGLDPLTFPPSTYQDNYAEVTYWTKC